MFLVKITQHFFGPEERVSLLSQYGRGGFPDPIYFETREAAQEAIDQEDDGVYYTTYNELGRPDYEIIEARAAHSDETFSYYFG